MVKQFDINVETRGYRPTYFDVTNDVRDFIKESGITNGIVLVQTAHTTCSVFFEEYAHDQDICGYDFLQVDLNNGLNKIFPKQTTDTTEYRYPGPLHLKFGSQFDPDVFHNGTLVNGDAHLKATLIGSSCTFAIIDGVMNTGEFGYIYFVDWDGNRPRKRRCHVTVIGE